MRVLDLPPDPAGRAAMTLAERRVQIPRRAADADQVSRALTTALPAEKVRLLLEIIDAKDEELRQLRERLNAAPPVSLPAEWRLTVKETEIFLALYKRKIGAVSKDALYNALYFNITEEEVPQKKIIDVFICHMRRKLNFFGIQIETVWGHGYVLAEDSRKIIDRIAAEQDLGGGER